MLLIPMIIRGGMKVFKKLPHSESLLKVYETSRKLKN